MFKKKKDPIEDVKESNYVSVEVDGTTNVVFKICQSVKIYERHKASRTICEID